MSLHKHNLVIHESDLPRGKGWSPLTWQVLEGKESIPITLFEASEKVDAGQIYLQENIKLDGCELVDDLRRKQGEATISVALKFVDNYATVTGKPQKGEETFYKRRGPSDSRLDLDKTIREQFNLLRVCDNERYPAYFEYGGKKYILKIFREE
jgi:methionyl-tRNA formyltransferase